jgi:lysophospholipase
VSLKELHHVVGNRLPPGAIVVPVRTRDGLNLRTARWSAKASRGSVVIATGRSEFIEEYAEIISALVARSFDVIALDWRGQGGSDREIRRLHRAYVSSFAGYRRDLEALEQQVLRPFAPKPWFALGHSMGAAILLDQAHDGLSPFDRLILSAPLVDLPLRHKRLARALVLTADWLGLGTRLIPGGSDQSMFRRRPFENNVLTSDRRQYERLSRLTEALPQLVIGSPTIRWVACAFRLIRKFSAPRFAIETLIPVLIVAAGDDRLVDTAATERLAIKLKAGRCITIPDARHQVIMEREEILAQFWAAFDAFVPGETSQEAVKPKVPRRRSWLAWLRRPRDRSDVPAPQSAPDPAVPVSSGSA